MVGTLLASKVQQWYGIEISSNPYEACYNTRHYYLLSLPDQNKDLCATKHEQMDNANHNSKDGLT